MQDPRDAIQGGQWKCVVGGVRFRGEQLLQFGRSGYDGAATDIYGCSPFFQ